MPNYNADNGLASQLKNLTDRITALETQQTFVVSDINNVKRVQLGQLPNKDYGLYVADTAGHSQEILPGVDAYVNGALSTTSTSPASIAGSPTVTATIGASGDFEVTAGAFMSVPGSATAFAFLVIDGGSPLQLFGTVVSGTTGITTSVQATRKYSKWAGTTLTPGSHTFTMVYDTTTGTATFSANYLKIQPI